MKAIIIASILTILLVILLRPSPVTDLRNRIFKARNAVKNVNRGGCGYHTIYVREYLDSRGIKSSIIRIKKPLHFMNKVNDVYIDNNGFFSKAYPALWFEHDTVSPQYLRNLLNDSTFWNKKFNRADSAKLKQILLE